MTTVITENTDIQSIEEIFNRFSDSFENMGNGVFWLEIPSADISLKKLTQEDLQRKYKLQIAWSSSTCRS